MSAPSFRPASSRSINLESDDNGICAEHRRSGRGACSPSSLVYALPPVAWPCRRGPAAFDDAPVHRQRPSHVLSLATSDTIWCGESSPSGTAPQAFAPLPHSWNGVSPPAARGDTPHPALDEDFSVELAGYICQSCEREVTTAGDAGTVSVFGAMEWGIADSSWAG
jgi:hypothetical protein